MNHKVWIALGVAALIGLLFLTSDHKRTEKTPAPHVLKQTASVPRATQKDEAAWLIEPGIRVGPITPKSTLADLQKYFGNANVKPQKIYQAEGEAYDGVVVFPDEPGKRLEIIWKVQSGKGARTPGSVMIRGAGMEESASHWHTANGVSLGTSIQTLEALNGAPFTLAGFGWDYGGVVLSWGDQGKLKEAFQQKGLIIRLAPSKNTPPKALEAVQGDASFSSDHPGMQTARPVVQEITVVFP